MRLSTTDHQILRIAIPAIISNITVPLLGLVDMSIVGHLGSAAYIGAIAIGGMLFNMIYWLFGFLRMGTGGLTAQAFGARDFSEAVRILLRSLSIAMVLALVLILLQVPIRFTAFLLIDAGAEVKHLATIYFHICIWGAPATLCLYGFNGWFFGMQNSRYPMYIAIAQNVVNIAASLLFVFVFGMKVEGVALGTLIAQYGGLFMAVSLWVKRYATLRKHLAYTGLFASGAMWRFFRVNRDIFLRTLCLVSVSVYFTSAGAAYGDITLAVNSLLMQFFSLFSYIMDGFAYAGEALTGRYVGARKSKALLATVGKLFVWGLCLSLLFTALYGLGGRGFLSLLTDNRPVIDASMEYFYWVLAIPLVAFSSFLFDGICIGATATRIMIKSMFAATVCFFFVYTSLHILWANHALWLAFILYLGTRGAMQAWWLRSYHIPTGHP